MGEPRVWEIEMTRFGRLLYACAVDGPLGWPAVFIAKICPADWQIAYCGPMRARDDKEGR